MRLALLALDHQAGSLRLTDDQDGAEALVGVDLRRETLAAIRALRESGARVALVLGERARPEWAPRVARHVPEVDEVIAPGGRQAADVAPAETLVVASDRATRAAAVAQGRLALPHAALVPAALAGRTLAFARVTGPRERFGKLPDTVPYFVDRAPGGEWLMFAATTSAAIALAPSLGLRVETLPLDLATEDALLVRLDRDRASAAGALAGRRVLAADEGMVVVALGPQEANEVPGLHGAHGHFQALLPDPGLLAPAPPAGFAEFDAQLVAGRLRLATEKIAPHRIDPGILDDLRIASCPVTAAQIQADVDRYRGAAPLDASGAIESRDARHPDNPRVVQALLADLRAMGYCAYTHSFTMGGATLHNVIADLPGRGSLVIDPRIIDKLRKAILGRPPIELMDVWRREIGAIEDPHLAEHALQHLPPYDAQRAIEASVGLKPWAPWWMKCPAAGPGAELVIVGCHLDSTGASDGAYDPLTDPAPGADDDASGIAATLAAARYLAGFRGKLRHTVRFCFFNAEEYGRLGSQAYASMLKAANAPVRAVVCSDMIGHNAHPARLFEIHAGHTDPAVRDLCVPIAQRVASWAAALGALEPAQIYKGTIGSGGANRDVYDGAIGRSDHASFQQHGYPAVVVSEDFFANLASEPGADANPNYHRAADTSIDPAFAADIACAIALAAKDLAQG